jgi:hypothetical protein
MVRMRGGKGESSVSRGVHLFRDGGLIPLILYMIGREIS